MFVLTVNANGSFVWLGVFRPVRGGVIAVTVGAPDYAFGSAQAQFNQVLNSVQFAP